MRRFRRAEAITLIATSRASACAVVGTQPCNSESCPIRCRNSRNPGSAASPGCSAACRSGPRLSPYAYRTITLGDNPYSTRSLPQMRAAADVPHLAGYPFGVVGEQERGDRGEVVGLAQPAGLAEREE